MITWRSILLVAGCSLLTAFASAQPNQPTFCFVLAEDQDTPTPFTRPVSVVYVGSERLDYVGINATYAGPLQELKLWGGALFTDSTEGWVKYNPPERICTECHLLVVSGEDTLRIDLPSDPIGLVQQALERWDRDTPEVIRFKPGTFAFSELIGTPWATNAAKFLAERLIAEDAANYRKQLAEQEAWYTAHPPAPPPMEPPPLPPPVTQEQWEVELAKRPGLVKVDIAKVSGDTVQVRITGSVMLDGGCASSMPLMAVELRTDTGWVERLPMHDWQLDCGLAQADWKDRQVTIPLAWWVYNFRNGGDGLLSPGTYRLRFRGANMKDMRTAPFDLRPPDR